MGLYWRVHVPKRANKIGLAVLQLLFGIIKVLKQEAKPAKPHGIYSNHSNNYDSEDSLVFGLSMALCRTSSAAPGADRCLSQQTAMGHLGTGIPWTMTGQSKCAWLIMVNLVF